MQVFVAGGSVLRCLMQAQGGREDAFKGSDVDLFLFGLSSEEAMAKLHTINKHIWQAKWKTMPPAKKGKTMPPAKKMRASEHVSLKELSDTAVLYARTKGSVTFVTMIKKESVLSKAYPPARGWEYQLHNRGPHLDIAEHTFSSTDFGTDDDADGLLVIYGGRGRCSRGSC